MKTPEEIKTWLNGCKDKSGCQLCYNDWVCKENAYALTYIQQLEADNSRLNDTIRNLTELLNAAHEETAKARRERDAAVYDVGNMDVCDTCIHGFAARNDCLSINVVRWRHYYLSLSSWCSVSI